MKFIPYIYIVIFFTLLLSSISSNLIAQSSQYRVHGTILDSLNRERLPYVAVRIKNSTIGCSSDNNGNFSFFSPNRIDTLLISCIGYKDKKYIFDKTTKFPIRIELSPEVQELSEIIIKPKKERYSKRDNPAVALARRLIEKRDNNSPKNKPFYSRDRHERLNVALNNFSGAQGSHFGKQFAFLDQYVDTSLISGVPILHISHREMLAKDYYNRSPFFEKQRIKAKQRAGFDDVISAESIEAIYEETFKDVDIFQDNISLFRNKFVSPISTFGLSFYKYYIMDTVLVEGKKCVDLAFTPFNSQSLGFTGHVYVTLDSTYFIKLVQLSVPRDINLNFVQYMNIKQDFSRLPDGTRMLNNESLVTEFKIVNQINGFYASRQVAYRNYDFINPADEKVAKHPGTITEEENAWRRDDEYWSEHRLVDVSDKETSVKEMMTNLRSKPLYYWAEKGITFLFTGWVPIREHEPPFFYGPINTTASYNELEGFRLRAGAMSSAYLNPHIFGKFFLAYGFRDEKLKYMGELEYSFSKKKEHPNEFPIHSIKASYENDIYQYGQTYLYTNKDNMFLSIKREDDNKIGYLRVGELTYTKEFYNHFSYVATLRHRVDLATHLIPFERTHTIDGVTTSEFAESLTQSELEIKLRFAPKEKFVQTKWNRHTMVPENPIFTLSHRIGVKGVLGSDFNYQRTEIGFKKRFWFSAFGYTNCILKAGKVWNRVPFPMLIIPNANLSYTVQPESFSLMNAMEFFNDEYASWDLTYFMNGLVFNRLPLIKKLNWREVIAFKGMFGNLSHKNRPDNLNTGDLFKLPYQDNAYHYLGSTPYIEVSVGIENIFKILRIDYVRRLTYKNYPGIDKDGIRIMLHAQF